MNDSLLSFKPILSGIHKASVEYFRLNTGSVSSPVILWEAYKAVVWGHVIQVASQRKKERIQTRRKLEQNLEDRSAAFKLTPTPANRGSLDKARTDLDLCLTDKWTAVYAGPTRNGMPWRINPMCCWPTDCIPSPRNFLP